MFTRPIDKLHLFVVGVLVPLTVVCAVAGRLARWPQLLGEYALILGIVTAAAFAARHESRLPTWLRLITEFYPAVVVPLVYDSLGFLIPALNPVERDAALIAIDRALFGTDPGIWLQRLSCLWFNEVMFSAYCTFFFFPLVVGMTLWRRSEAMGKRFVFLAVLTFYVSYGGYMLVPARGPRAALAPQAWNALRATPIARAVSGTLNSMERNRVDAFPSGHVMVTAVCLLAAARHARRLLVVLLPIGLLLVFSTVFCLYHYVIDVIAGLAAALVMPALAGWLYERLDRPRGMAIGT